MAPALSGVWWGPEAGVVGSRAAADASATAVSGNEHLLLVVTLSILTAVLLGSLLVLLCASCQGQKKTANTHVLGDHENLMNGLSERETASQSANSPQTDGAVSTSHNGPLTSGTILTETQDTSPQLSEEMLSSQSELRSSKCPQDRELPSIPPGNALIGEQPPASGDSPYEVVKEMVVGLRDVTTEDSLYETVKELKDQHVQPCPPNGTATQPCPEEAPPPAPLLNGHVSPATPERGPLCDRVEYASVDLNKKSRHSADMEARRRSDQAAAPSRAAPEELPPPVPEKVLDENDNQPVVPNGVGGAGMQNGSYTPLCLQASTTTFCQTMSLLCTLRSTKQTVTVLLVRTTRSTTTAASQRSRVWSRPHPPVTSTPLSKTSTRRLTKPRRGTTPFWRAWIPATKPSAFQSQPARRQEVMLPELNLTTRVWRSWDSFRKCPAFESAVERAFASGH